MASHDRLILIVAASPLFPRNLDNAVMATTPTDMTRLLGVPTLRLNLAIGSAGARCPTLPAAFRASSFSVRRPASSLQESIALGA